MTDALVLDTGAWLLALQGRQPFADALEDASTLIVPALVLTELAYFLRRDRSRLHRVLQSIVGGEYEYQPPIPGDLARARELDRKFKNLELGLVDSTVAALAERLGVHRVLTIDSHFSVIRIGARYQTALEVVGGPLSR